MLSINLDANESNISLDANKSDIYFVRNRFTLFILAFVGKTFFVVLLMVKLIEPYFADCWRGSKDQGWIQLMLNVATSSMEYKWVWSLLNYSPTPLFIGMLKSNVNISIRPPECYLSVVYYKVIAKSLGFSLGDAIIWLHFVKDVFVRKYSFIWLLQW